MTRDTFRTLAWISIAWLGLPATAAPPPRASGIGTTACPATGAGPVAALQVAGRVLVSRDGSSFHEAVDGEAVYPGERVLVAPRSAVTVIHADGCRQTHDAPGIQTIHADCAAQLVGTSAPTGVRPPGTHAEPTPPAVTGALVGALVEQGPPVPAVGH